VKDPSTAVGKRWMTYGVSLAEGSNVEESQATGQGVNDKG